MTPPRRSSLMRLALLLIVAWLVLPAAPRRAAASEGTVERFALVIGNNQPEAGSPVATLRYADDDAVATQRLLLESGARSLLLVRLDADSQRVARDLPIADAPTGAALERAFGVLERDMRAAVERGVQVEFLLFFSGHGDVAGGEGFVLLEDERFTRSRLFELLARSPAAHNHVFVDACRSYFLVFDRGPGGSRVPYAGAALPASVPAHLDNTGFVLSTSSARDSHEWERYQGGILSHEVRSALRGAADTNLDLRISYAELGAFLAKANQAIENPQFRPEFTLRAPRLELEREVLSWPERAAAIELGSAYLGPFYVETARGDRLLDAHPAPGQRLALWMPDERPLFVRRKDGLGEARVTGHAPQQIEAFSFVEPELTSRGAANLALERLFATPFGDADVHAFVRGARDAARVSLDSSEPPASSSRRTLRLITGVVGLGAASAGLSLTTLALSNYVRADGQSQRRIEALNRQSRALHRASLACYSGALVAGAVWAWASLWPEAPVALTPAPLDASSAGPRVGLGLALQF